MKKNPLFLLIAMVALFSCKKEGSGGSSGNWLLSKVYFNNILEREYIYSIDGNVLRTNFYLTGGGQSTLSSYQLFEYNTDGTIRQVFNFSKDHYATTRKIYTYSAAGKVSRIDEATIFTGDDDLDNMDYFEVFSYDAKGQLTQVVRRLTNSTLHSRQEYTYDDKSNLVKYEGYNMDNGALVIKQRMEIVPGEKQMPAHWKELLVEPNDMSLYELYITQQTFTSWWGGPALVGVWTYPQRTYNSQGYLTDATYQLSSNGSVNSVERKFEYVQ